MKPHLFCQCVFSSLLAIFVCAGCSEDIATAPQSTGTHSDHLIAASSVGKYLIGQSTLEGILGSDTPDNRKRFSDAGLQFEFNQGKELTGVTVTSADYELENGLTIGSPSSEVREKLGEPRATKIESEPKGIQIDALVYDDFVFLLDESQKVGAIRIGK